MIENLDVTIEDYFQKVEELKNDGYEMMVDLTAIDWFRKTLWDWKNTCPV